MTLLPGEALEEESGIEIEEIRVDGGASRNDFLMQFQADVLGKRIVRPSILETTALGAAYMAGLAVDFWSGRKELAQLRRTDRVYEPGMDGAERERLYREWRMAVDRSRDWAARASK